MIASTSARVLFVHVQKTGGTSVTHLLLDSLGDARRCHDLPGGKHATMATALGTRPEFADYFVCGFVRNPWARMWSWHSMVMRRAAAAPHRLEKNPFWKEVAMNYSDFESFVLRGPDQLPRLRVAQLDYLRTEDREADFIGRTETLQSDIAVLAERLGLPVVAELPQSNAGPPTTYQDHYSDAMRERVAELFALDVGRFDYTF